MSNARATNELRNTLEDVGAVESRVSSVDADWRREAKTLFEWNPSKSLLASIRSWQRVQSYHVWARWVPSRIAVARHRFWSVVTGADIPVNSRIGGGLLIPHPNGIVIHPMAEIGVNCLILQQVTIGQAGKGVPRIAGHVDIGAGAKIIGNVRIGEHALVGANAVVVSDVPAHATVVGVPAKVVRRRVV